MIKCTKHSHIIPTWAQQSDLSCVYVPSLLSSCKLEVSNAKLSCLKQYRKKLITVFPAFPSLVTHSRI